MPSRESKELQMACSRVVPIIASVAVLALGSASGANRHSSGCHQYGLGTIEGLTAIKVLVPAGGGLPVKSPTAICFDLPIRELASLREALARGPVEVDVFDDGARQLMSRGTLFAIDNVVNQGHVRVRAIFLDPN